MTVSFLGFLLFAVLFFGGGYVCGNKWPWTTVKKAVDEKVAEKVAEAKAEIKAEVKAEVVAEVKAEQPAPPAA